MAMAMTQTDVITSWAHRWRCLTAWGAELPATFRIAPRPARITQRLGSANCYLQRATIYTTGRLDEDLCTALHELAHLAVPTSEHHGDIWRQMYIRASAEALSCNASDFDVQVTIIDLDRQVKDAVNAWLVRSGQAVVLKAIGVLL